MSITEVIEMPVLIEAARARTLTEATARISHSDDSNSKKKKFNKLVQGSAAV